MDAFGGGKVYEFCEWLMLRPLSATSAFDLLKKRVLRRAFNYPPPIVAGPSVIQPQSAGITE
jgi:hypothetical protein